MLGEKKEGRKKGGQARRSGMRAGNGKEGGGQVWKTLILPSSVLFGSLCTRFPLETTVNAAVV